MLPCLLLYRCVCVLQSADLSEDRHSAHPEESPHPKPPWSQDGHADKQLEEKTAEFAPKPSNSQFGAPRPPRGFESPQFRPYQGQRPFGPRSRGLGRGDTFFGPRNERPWFRRGGNFPPRGSRGPQEPPMFRGPRSQAMRGPHGTLHPGGPPSDSDSINPPHDCRPPGMLESRDEAQSMKPPQEGPPFMPRGDHPSNQRHPRFFPREPRFRFDRPRQPHDMMDQFPRGRHGPPLMRGPRPEGSSLLGAPPQDVPRGFRPPFRPPLFPQGDSRPPLFSQEDSRKRSFRSSEFKDVDEERQHDKESDPQQEESRKFPYGPEVDEQHQFDEEGDNEHDQEHDSHRDFENQEPLGDTKVPNGSQFHPKPFEKFPATSFKDHGESRPQGEDKKNSKNIPPLFAKPPKPEDEQADENYPPNEEEGYGEGEEDGYEDDRMFPQGEHGNKGDAMFGREDEDSEMPHPKRRAFAAGSGEEDVKAEDVPEQEGVEQEGEGKEHEAPEGEEQPMEEEESGGGDQDWRSGKPVIEEGFQSQRFRGRGSRGNRGGFGRGRFGGRFERPSWHPPPDDVQHPPDLMSLPPDHMGPPPDHMGAPPDHMGPPPDHMGPPDHRGPPPDLMGPPRGFMGPRGRMGPPRGHRGHPRDHFGPRGHRGPHPDFMRPPRDHMGPPPDFMGPPRDHMGPPRDHHMGPPWERMGPPRDHMGPPRDHMGPPPDFMGPGHMMHPPDHMGPHPDHMGPPPDHMGPPHDHMRPPPGHPRFHPREFEFRHGERDFHPDGPPPHGPMGDRFDRDFREGDPGFFDDRPPEEGRFDDRGAPYGDEGGPGEEDPGMEGEGPVRFFGSDRYRDEPGRYGDLPRRDFPGRGRERGGYAGLKLESHDWNHGASPHHDRGKCFPCNLPIRLLHSLPLFSEK